MKINLWWFVGATLAGWWFGEDVAGAVVRAEPVTTAAIITAVTAAAVGGAQMDQAKGQRTEAKREGRRQAGKAEERVSQERDRIEQAENQEAAAMGQRQTRERQRALASTRGGRRSTLLTGPGGVSGPAPTQRATLLGA